MYYYILIYIIIYYYILLYIIIYYTGFILKLYFKIFYFNKEIISLNILFI